MDVQTERAFQKQPHMFAGKARVLSRSSRKGARYVKSIGLGFKIPTKAREGRYIDKKCPFTGNVSIRGKLLRGVVHRTFMKNTITIRRDYLHYIKKYRRYEKRHKMISAHSPPWRGETEFQRFTFQNSRAERHPGKHVSEISEYEQVMRP